MQTSQYLRKPFAVTAALVTTDELDEIAAWCEGSVRPLGDTKIDGHKSDELCIRVPVQNASNTRQTIAFLGDYVVLSGRSSFRVYTPSAFKNSFDRQTTAPNKRK